MLDKDKFIPLFPGGWWMEYFRGMGIKLINSNRAGNGLTYATHQTFQPGNIPHNKGIKKK